MNEKVTHCVVNLCILLETLKLERANRCIAALKNIGCNVTLPAEALRLSTISVDNLVEKCR